METSVETEYQNTPGLNSYAAKARGDRTFLDFEESLKSWIVEAGPMVYRSRTAVGYLGALLADFLAWDDTGQLFSTDDIEIGLSRVGYASGAITVGGKILWVLILEKETK